MEEAYKDGRAEEIAEGGAKGIFADSVTRAVRDCQREGIMTKFFQEYSLEEVIDMLYAEWNWDKAVAVGRKEAFEDGRAEGEAKGMARGRVEGRTEGKRQDILELLEDLGEIPADIQDCIRAQEDMATLRRWLKAAARAVSFEDFQKEIN